MKYIHFKNSKALWGIAIFLIFPLMSPSYNIYKQKIGCSDSRDIDIKQSIITELEFIDKTIDSLTERGEQDNE